MRKNSSFFIFCSYALLLFCSAFAEASDTVIQRIDVEGLYSIKQDELLDMLNIKTGDILDRKKIDSGIKLAFLKGIFEDVSVEADDNDRSHVIIKVKERERINKIYVKGNKRLSRKAIKSYFLFKQDQFMRYDLMDDYVMKLKGVLSEVGFPEADLNLQVEKKSKPYRVNLVLTVNEGEPEIISSIRINGPQEAGKSMKLSKGSIYDQVKLKKDMENIRAYYKRSGYLNPVVGPYAFSNGELSLEVKPGKKLVIKFEGNKIADSKTLLKEVPFFEAEDFRDDLVEEATSRIVSLYHGLGHPFIQAAPVVTSSDDVINLEFFIFEGDKVIVNTIKFNGITIPEKNLKEVMSFKERAPYNPDLLDSDKSTLTEFYNALGYLNVRIDDFRIAIKDLRAEITVSISEGAQTLIDGIEIKGAQQIPEEEIRKAIKIKDGDPYNEVDISDARYRIIEIYGNAGFTDARVDVKQSLIENRVKIIFEIEEGQLTFFGKTVISGNLDTKRDVINRELLYKEGAPFNYGLLTRTRQKLYKVGLFTDVEIETLEREDSTKNIRVNVKEGNAGVFEIGVGYGDYEKYRGSIGIGYKNLFGMNRQLSLRTEFSSLEQRYIIEYLEPYFLNRPLPFRVLFLRENRTEISLDTRETRFKLRRYTVSAGIEKKLSERLKAELYYEFSLVNTFDVQPDVILSKEDTGTLAISGIRTGIVYDSRDNPFDPRKGILAGVSVKAASGVLFSQTDFVKLIVHGSAYQALSKRFVLAASVRSGVANGFNETIELPLVERFFLGGRSTVRGYEQDTLGPKGVNGTPTGGNVFVQTNLELRTYLGRGFGLVTFVDGGNVWIKTRDVRFLEMKYTTGMGIRYNTPVGPLRVDYGFKLNREAGESRGEIHFSIGHAF